MESSCEEAHSKRTNGRIYAAIDLKSFFASVECRERGLNPLTTNLTVADKSRTNKTICLAVSPSLKSYGIPGRPRLFELERKVEEINAIRRLALPNRSFSGKSWDNETVKNRPDVQLDYIVAKPGMSRYADYSTRIYRIYLKYVSADDIHVYSIDEVFIDLTKYLKLYDLSAYELTVKMISEVLSTTGITATAGIGTNLYLAKVAMDIVAKKMPANRDGVRIAQLDEMSYRKELWEHTPLSDFWRVGKGYCRKLERAGLMTMGDIARCSIGKSSSYHNEDLLYSMFGVNAELLIDHAWGWEPCTISDIKAYKPAVKTLGAGQVLREPYSFEKARLIVKEMADGLALDLLSKNLETDSVVLNISYDVKCLKQENMRKYYDSIGGKISSDRYGRAVPESVRGSADIGVFTSSSRLITEAFLKIFDEKADPRLLIRRINVTAKNAVPAQSGKKNGCVQLDLFSECAEYGEKNDKREEKLKKEKNVQLAVLNVKRKFGKNSVVKGMNLEEGATSMIRNGQIGGHSA